MVILLSMLNPKFEYQVVKFVYDELIKNRHDAGDNYIKMTLALFSLPNFTQNELSIVNKGIRCIVFGNDKVVSKDYRQTAKPEQLKEISELELDIYKMIIRKKIKSFEELHEDLKAIWREKHLEPNF